MNGWNSSISRYANVTDARQRCLPMSGNLKTQIGQPDLIILFTSTVAHKMVHCALKEAQRYNIPVERAHSSSASALENVLLECCR